MRAALFLAPLALVGAAFLALGACNSGMSDCPAKEAIQPGAACSDDDLQCAYDLSTPAPACDGTTTVLATSCTCTKGTWSCPSAVACPSGDDGAAGDDAADSSTGDDASDAAPPSDASDAG